MKTNTKLKAMYKLAAEIKLPEPYVMKSAEGLTGRIERAAQAATEAGAVRTVIFSDFWDDHCMGRPLYVCGGRRAYITTPTYIRDVLGFVQYVSCFEQLKTLLLIETANGQWVTAQLSEDTTAEDILKRLMGYMPIELSRRRK